MEELNPRILLVEDDQSLVGYTQRYLERLGFQVEACATLQEGWEALRAAPGLFALAIVDVSLTGREGADFGRRLQQEHPHLPVLYWSGYPADLEQLREGHAGRVEFLPKPFAPNQLAEAIRRLTEDRSRGTSAGTQN